MKVTLKFEILLPTLIMILMAWGSAIAQEKSIDDSKSKNMEIAFLLFDNYETLDVFGPVEIWIEDKDNDSFVAE